MARAQSTAAIVKQAEQTQFITQDLVYKTVDTVQLHLTVYTLKPEKRPRPAIILFFGGGWVNGTPAQFEHQARYFAQRGLIAVLADYRTQSKNGTTPFDAVEDARSAIRYLRRHAKQLHIDPQRIIGSGGSAGGHLAAAADLTHLDTPGEDTAISARPNALVLFNPVIDNGPGGYGYEKTGSRYLEISPLHNIRAGAAPTILFFGTRDKFVPVATARSYQQKMQAAGNRCELFLYDGQPHGFFNHRDGSDDHYFLETLKEADRFLVSLGYLKALDQSN